MTEDRQVQAGRKEFGTVKTDNSFNKSDSNKRKKYRGGSWIGMKGSLQRLGPKT